MMCRGVFGVYVFMVGYGLGLENESRRLIKNVMLKNDECRDGTISTA